MKKMNFTAKISALAIFAGVILSAINVSAYGPERRTFTDQNPADYVTFNSITNNPGMGDERNFVRIREAGVGSYVDKIDIVPGKTYEVWTYVHNNAATKYNSREHNYRGLAIDTKLKVTLPATVKKGQAARVVSTISAKNANPSSVWDEATLTSSQRDVILNYVQGSAIVATSNGAVKGRGFNNNELFGSGSLLGYDALNGILPGCTQYTMTVVYKFTANYPDFEVNKTVSKKGANAWGENYTAKEGEVVDFKITYKNTGTVTQNNVVIQDILPQGLSLVPGTTRITTPSDQAGKTLNDDVASKGIGIGRYSIGGSATLTFSAKVDSGKLVCGNNSLTNTAKAITENGSKQDTAKITVQKNCTTPPPTDNCKVTGKTHLKKNDPKCFEPCKITGKTHLKQDDPKCKQDDRCTVKGRESLPKNDPKCFEPCQIKGKENLKKDDPKCFEPCIVKGKENLKKDDPKCSDPCPVKGKENLKANDPNCFEPCVIKGKEGLKSTDPNCVENCKISGRESLKSTDIDCSEPCRIAGKEKLNAKDPACAETQIPNELPKTGPMEAAMMIIAIMAISGALAYWIRSREEMKKVVLGAKKESDNSEEDLN